MMMLLLSLLMATRYALTDSFAINLIVRNYGQARRDTIRVEVLRTLNDNSTITYDSLFQSTKYSDTLTFVIRKGREAGFGNNSFRITLDPDGILPELNEQNNVANELLFIPSNGTKNLFPGNFAIVTLNKRFPFRQPICFQQNRISFWRLILLIRSTVMSGKESYC